MMKEVKEIARRTSPHQVYLVCDAMTGQDAVTSAKAFDQELALDGVILTKLDGDARGGAALSVKAVTGKPIKFIGVGEKLDKLEEFHPDRMANRILGMGDVVSLVEKAQDTIDAEEAAAMQQKLLKAEFTFEDFLKQLGQMRKMGSSRTSWDDAGAWAARCRRFNIADDEITRVEAIIQSMTAKERRSPSSSTARRRVEDSHGQRDGAGRRIGAPQAVPPDAGHDEGDRQRREVRDGRARRGCLTPGARVKAFKQRSKRKQKPREARSGAEKHKCGRLDSTRRK